MKKFIQHILRCCTTFQKCILAFLAILLCFSFCLTSFQVFHILTTKESSIKSSKDIKQTSSTNVQKDSTILETTEDAGKEYIDNTLFLGDSNTVRFMDFLDSENHPYTTKNNTIAVVGMGVQAIDSLECMEFSTGIYTMVESVKIMQPERILITFGTNNLSSSDSKEAREEFIQTYQSQLKKLQDASPLTTIIVNAIPPISKDTTYTNLNMDVITHWNEAILQMCKDNGWHYLNSSEVLYDASTKYAKEDYMDGDGLHLSEDGVDALFHYIRTHAYRSDQKPEKVDVPEIIGPKTNLYTINPLDGKEFDNSVLQPTAAPRSTYTEQQTQTNEPSTGQTDVNSNQEITTNPDVQDDSTEIPIPPVTDGSDIPPSQETNPDQSIPQEPVNPEPEPSTEESGGEQ